MSYCVCGGVTEEPGRPLCYVCEEANRPIQPKERKVKTPKECEAQASEEGHQGLIRARRAAEIAYEEAAKAAQPGWLERTESPVEKEHAELVRLAVRTCEINAANGFDPTTWENFASKMMLVITELDEAEEEGPLLSTFEEEIADTAIRLLDALQNLWPDRWANRIHVSNPMDICASIHSNLWWILKPICGAVETWRKEKEGSDMVCFYLDVALRQCAQFLEAYGLSPLPHLIDRKLDKNAKRPHLHGKRRSS